MSSGVLTSDIIEIIEPESCLFNVLAQRASNIIKYDYFGPPDLCYLVKEYKGGLLSSPLRAGYFHYVYGIDASSSASVAVYIKDLIKRQEKNNKI